MSEFDELLLRRPTRDAIERAAMSWSLCAPEENEYERDDALGDAFVWEALYDEMWELWSKTS